MEPRNETGWRHSPATLSLIAAAARTYTTSIQSALLAAGYSDVPPTAFRIFGLLSLGEASAQELAKALSTSKQGISRLADLLAARGYLIKRPDERDRRRVGLSLSQKGEAITAVARLAIEVVDQELGQLVTAEDIAAARLVLGALASMRSA